MGFKELSERASKNTLLLQYERKALLKLYFFYGSLKKSKMLELELKLISEVMII